ncbi:MAG: NUDIX domain-containing protein [Acetobacteraceae bacterium]|nr:NUDIX domain-containing protein [Acetobacteraceae bacterium]
MAAQSDYMSRVQTLLRHIRACNNAALPGGRLPFRVAGQKVGWVQPGLAERLASLGARRMGDGLDVQPPQLQPLARALADAGVLRWRAEPFDVRVAPDGPVLGQVDRGALPKLGIGAMGVHLNGLVESGGETRLWVARRAANKLLDPGKLDHLVAGGVPAGYDPMQTLLKEGEEEAGLPPELTRRAQPAGRIAYAMEREEGLRRDWLTCYDLVLPPEFVPEARDGEVEAFELWPLPRVLDAVRKTDDFKFNVNLVLIDLFLRRGLVLGQEGAELRAALSSAKSA